MIMSSPRLCRWSWYNVQLRLWTRSRLQRLEFGVSPLGPRPPQLNRSNSSSQMRVISSASNTKLCIRLQLLRHYSSITAGITQPWQRFCLRHLRAPGLPQRRPLPVSILPFSLRLLTKIVEDLGRGIWNDSVMQRLYRLMRNYIFSMQVSVTLQRYLIRALS